MACTGEARHVHADLRHHDTGREVTDPGHRRQQAGALPDRRERLSHGRIQFGQRALWVSHQSPLAEEALGLFGALYDIEQLAAELDAGGRRRLRQLRSKPIADTLHQWLVLHRQRATDGTAMAGAIDYSLKRWAAITRFLADPAVPIANNWMENRIRPVAIGRSNWLFAGSLRGGQRAAAVMSLIESARMNGHDQYAYLRDVLERLPTQPDRRIDELLPHRWTPPACQAPASLIDEGRDCTRTSGFPVRDELAIPDGFCWSAPRSLTRTLGASSGAGYANHGLTCRAINLLVA